MKIIEKANQKLKLRHIAYKNIYIPYVSSEFYSVCSTLTSRLNGEKELIYITRGCCSSLLYKKKTAC